MTDEIVEQGPDDLEEYGKVSIAFDVKSKFRVDPVDGTGLGGFQFIEEPVNPAWTKDYDAEKDEGPTRWRRWNLSNWGFCAAFEGDQRIGGAVVAFNTEGVDSLQGRKELAALWDIRVDPEHRRNGIGAELFRWAEMLATERDCLLLKIETQNINVPACRFYANQGAVLGNVDQYAYPDFPDEVRLDWFKALQ